MSKAEQVAKYIKLALAIALFVRGKVSVQAAIAQASAFTDVAAEQGLLPTEEELS